MREILKALTRVKDNLTLVELEECLKYDQSYLCAKHRPKSKDLPYEIQDILDDYWLALLSVYLEANIKNSWIDITERLPPENEVILIYSDKNDFAKRTYVRQEDTYYTYPDMIEVSDPTHWRHFPQPPEN